MEVNAIAVVRVAAVDVQQTLCTAAVEWLSRGLKVVPRDAGTDVLLLAFDEGSGGHAGSIGLALVAILLTQGCGAVTPQSCRDGGGQKKQHGVKYNSFCISKMLVCEHRKWA